MIDCKFILPSSKFLIYRLLRITFFLLIIKKKIKEYGISRMEEHVKALHEAVNRLTKNCIASYEKQENSTIAKLVLRSDAPGMCNQLIENDITSANRYRNLQQEWFKLRGKEVKSLDYEKSHSMLHLLHKRYFHHEEGHPIVHEGL